MSTALICPSQRELEGQAPNSRNGDDAHRRGEIDLLIVHDRRAARYSIWALLSWKRDIRVTGTANSSAEALRLADQRRPHVCLISATRGEGEALTLASRMKHLIDPPRVLIFADAVDQRLACAATVAGADGVLCRYADPEAQAAVVRRAASAEQQFPDLQPSESARCWITSRTAIGRSSRCSWSTLLRTTSPACWVSAHAASSCDVRAL